MCFPALGVFLATLEEFQETVGKSHLCSHHILCIFTVPSIKDHRQAHEFIYVPDHRLRRFILFSLEYDFLDIIFPQAIGSGSIRGWSCTAKQTDDHKHKCCDSASRVQLRVLSIALVSEGAHQGLGFIILNSYLNTFSRGLS